MSTSTPFEKPNVLITGGSTGIGLGLARRFLDAGANVLVTGRNKDKLVQAAADHPTLDIFPNDIATPTEREALAAYVRKAMPELNVLINNAGIQRRVSLADDDASWRDRQLEIDTLLSGPVHLNHLLIPHILSHGKPAAIINVTSGGAYLPQPFAPIYSACKAALHSYTVNLRFSLRETNCRVIELIPPAVRTALAGPGSTHGVALDEFCDAVFDVMIRGENDEIGFGQTASDEFNVLQQLFRTQFAQFSDRFPVRCYA